MEYTLETKILFKIKNGTWEEEENLTMEELGFEQEQLKDYTRSEIEAEIQSLYEDWQRKYLDVGWSIVR